MQNKYSLWFIPDNPLKQELHREVNQIANEYHTPTFVPHVTLTVSTDLSLSQFLTATQNLATSMRPLTLKLANYGYSLTENRKCLYINVELTQELLNAYDQAKSIFKKEDAPLYMPHLSLMYGGPEITQEMKNEIIASIGNKYSGRTFRVDRLSTWETNQDVATWGLMAETLIN